MHATKTAAAVPGRKLICRYLKRGAAGQCTAEAVGDEYSEIVLCAHHLAEALTMLQRVGIGAAS